MAGPAVRAQICLIGGRVWVGLTAHIHTASTHVVNIPRVEMRQMRHQDWVHNLFTLHTHTRAMHIHYTHTHTHTRAMHSNTEPHGKVHNNR